MELDSASIRLRAIAYYESNKCDHEKCQIPDVDDLAYYFLKKNEDVRIDTRRSILLALSSPKTAKTLFLVEEMSGSDHVDLLIATTRQRFML